MRIVRPLLVPLVLLLGLTGMSQAHTDEPNAKSYFFEGKPEANGVLTVIETVKFDAPPAELTQRITNRAPFDRNRYYVYGISKASVTGVESLTSKVEGGYTVLSMKPSAKMKITYKIIETTRSELGSDGEISVFIWRAL